MKRRFGTLALLTILVFFSCKIGSTAASSSTPSPPTSTSPSSAPPGSLPSTEFGRAAWTDYAFFDAESPGSDYYVGAWTHVIEAMGSAPNSNDYPFVMPCSETVGGDGQLILTISGNIGYDVGAGSWAYNQNITSNSGDYSTVYVHPNQYSGYPVGQPDEAALRGWVYVAWHYKRAAAGTIVNQYLKFGLDGAVIRAPEDVIDGTGGWSSPLPSPAPEYATPVAICVGGGDRGSANLFMQYAKLYLMADAPSDAAVDAISRRIAPDPNAWADWPLIGADLRDVSGHGRNLEMNGSAYSGIAGPGF
jgi:hypothetical protein